MKQSFDPKQVESLLAQDTALQERLERSLARLAVRPGAEIDEAMLQQAMTEAGISAPQKGLRAMDDDALESVAGGRILFGEDGVNRNSWFVSLLSMLLAQDEGRPASAAGQTPLPREIRIDGKTYRVVRVGIPGSYKYMLEELT